MKQNYENFNWNDIEPLILEHQLLMSPGVWNGNYYSSEEIEKAFNITEWDAEDKTADLYYDHKDKLGESAQNWIGIVKNISHENGRVYGDLHVIHPIAAAQVSLENYRKRLGISPTVYGEKVNQTITDFTFKTFSLVRHPAIKTAFLNSEKDEAYDVIQEGLIRDPDNRYFINSKGDLCRLKEDTMKMAEMPTEKRKGLPALEFAYPEGRKLPINDPEHTKNALARWNQTDLPSDQKIPVLRRIIRAAKKFGIKVNDDLLKKAGFKMEEKMAKKEIDINELNEKIEKLAEAIKKLQEDDEEEEKTEEEETTEEKEEENQEEETEKAEEPETPEEEEEEKTETTEENEEEDSEPKETEEETEEKESEEDDDNDKEEMKELLLDPNATSFVRDYIASHEVSLTEAYAEYKKSQKKRQLEMREELEELNKRDLLSELKGGKTADEEMIRYLNNKLDREAK